MSYSRRQLYAMGEPLGDGATRREVGGKIIYGSGGDSTPEKQTTVVDIPDWAKPYAKESLGKAAALTSTPYQAYGGERIAQFTPMQKQAFGRAEGQQVAEQIGAGSGLAGTAGLMGLTGGYRPGQFGSQMSQYMSPYMDAVVQSQMDSAQRQADIAATQRGAQAVRAGAFGGSRQAIENAEAARALASQKGQIQATGLQSAYDRATDMYGREQALAEQSRQAGLGTALTAAGQLGQLGQQQFGQQMDITGQQAALGGQQRQATQDILSQQYQDFLNQQRAPYDQLSFMSSLIRGTPMGQTTTQYQPPPSTTSQLIGLGTAAAGAYGAYKGAAGGSIPSYASGGDVGGIVSLMNNVGSLSNDQLSRMQQTQKKPLTAAVVAEEILRRQEMQDDAAQQQALMNPAPQSTVAEEQLASAGLPGLPARNLERMGEATMADGGIVAFEDGGSIGYAEGRTVFRPRLPNESFSDYRQAMFQAELQAQQEQNAAQAAAREAERSSLQQRLAQERGGEIIPSNPFFDRAPLPGVPGVPTAPVASRTTTPASNAPRTDLRKGTDDPRVGLGGLTPAKAKAEQAAAAKATADKTATNKGAAPNAGLSALRPANDFFAKPRADIEALGKEEKALAEQEAEAVRKDQEELGVRGADKKKRIEEGLAGLAGKKDQNFNMALIEAGLAMMAGSSANAFENIGKGALVGTKAFTEGTERLNRERTRLDDKLGDLEDLQFTDEKDNKTALRNARNAVKQAEIGTKKALANLGIKEAETVIDLYKNERTLQNQRVVAGISAAGRSGADKPFNYQSAYADYLKANAGKTDPLGKPLPVLAYTDYIRQFALPQITGAGATNTLPQGATVLPRR
jgi:hypothetical protein